MYRGYQTLERILDNLAKSPSYALSLQCYSKLLCIISKDGKDGRVKVLMSRILKDLSLMASDITNKKAHKSKYIFIAIINLYITRRVFTLKQTLNTY
jgi:hypothetical protein